MHVMVKHDTYGFNTYAALRVGEIQENTKKDEWCWVEEELNIADWVTHEKITPSQIGKGSTWQEGPCFFIPAKGGMANLCLKLTK